MSYTLVDFEDLYTAVCEELKVPLTDGVTVARIKRDINMIYLNHIIPYKPRAWWWLTLTQDIQTPAKITGTVAITNNTATLTFATAPSVDMDGYFVKVQGHDEIVKISAHTAGATTATISTTWKNGTVASGTSYTAWKDYASLSSSMKEVVQITHDRRPVPLDAHNQAKFEEYRARTPQYEGHPVLYAVGDFNSSGDRVLRWYPACYEHSVTLHVLGVSEATALSSDGDEPLMPVEDRIAIFYGACSRAWARERNESEATKNWNLFMMKLAEMASKSQDAPQVTEMSVDRDHLMSTRYKRLFRNRRSRRWEAD